MYLEIGRADEASPLLQRLATMSAVLSAPDTLAAADNLANLDRVYYCQRTPGKALPALDQALGILDRLLGPRDIRIARTLATRALVYASLRLYREAIADLQNAEVMMDELPDATPSGILVARNAAGMAYALAKRPAKSEDRLREALSIAESLYGANRPVVVQVLRTRAAALRVNGRRKEAQALEQRAVAIFAANRGANPVGETVNAGALSLWQSAGKPLATAGTGPTPGTSPQSSGLYFSGCFPLLIDVNAEPKLKGRDDHDQNLRHACPASDAVSPQPPARYEPAVGGRNCRARRGQQTVARRALPLQ